MGDLIKNWPSDLPFVYLKQISFLRHACLLFVFPFYEFTADSSCCMNSFVILVSLDSRSENCRAEIFSTVLYKNGLFHQQLQYNTSVETPILRPFAREERSHKMSELKVFLQQVSLETGFEKVCVLFFFRNGKYLHVCLMLIKSS